MHLHQNCTHTSLYTCAHTHTRVYMHMDPHSSLLYTYAHTHNPFKKISRVAEPLNSSLWTTLWSLPAIYWAALPFLAKGSEVLSEVVQRVDHLKQNLNTLSTFELHKNCPTGGKSTMGEFLYHLTRPPQRLLPKGALKFIMFHQTVSGMWNRVKNLIQ